jgi:hypothetical protein
MEIPEVEMEEMDVDLKEEINDEELDVDPTCFSSILKKMSIF